MIIQSSSAKQRNLGRRGTSARAGHNPGHGQVLQTVIGNPGLTPKTTELCGQHRGFARFRYCIPSVLSVVLRGGFFDLCSTIFWQVLCPKHAQSATSDLNEFFKTAKISSGHRMPLQVVSGFC